MCQLKLAHSWPTSNTSKKKKERGGRINDTIIILKLKGSSKMLINFKDPKESHGSYGRLWQLEECTFERGGMSLLPSSPSEQHPRICCVENKRALHVHSISVMQVWQVQLWKRKEQQQPQAQYPSVTELAPLTLWVPRAGEIPKSGHLRISIKEVEIRIDGDH